MSTTKRPLYLGRPRFIVIHAFDPHLMCIPSLHVMVVIFAYTRFRKIAQLLGNEAELKEEIDELHEGALRITEAILYVKQHSINCIAAAMYAMSRFDRSGFPETEAEDFTSNLLIKEKTPSPEDGGEIRNHIITLYHRFLNEGKNAASWTKPLLDFLKPLRNK